MANVFCFYQKLLIEAVNLDQTRPSKQCECCNHLLDKCLISQGCQSGPGGPGRPGGQDGQGRQCGPTGLHKLWYPVVRDMSTWSKFGAHGEHGDVFLFSNLGAL